MNTKCKRPGFVLLMSALILSSFGAVRAQYYYKDIVVTAQINAGYRLLKDNKVKTVNVMPSALDPDEHAVTLQQTVYPSQQLVVTYTKVPDATESWLKSYYTAAGLLGKTVDSSAEVVTTSLYNYDGAGRISSISSNAVPVNDPAEREVHQWIYNGDGQAQKMIKIKDGVDSTVVNFTVDDDKNIAEESAVHKRDTLASTYYYYDASHRLTDVARYNARAHRILPDYMFEYNTAGQVTQMIVVPEGSADYQTWQYVYNAQGLKEKDLCYNKQKQRVASIDYNYSFGR